MEPVLKNEIKDSENRLFQVKWDGIRILTHFDKENIVLRTKSGKPRSNTYPELNEIRDTFEESSCVLDGEIITIDEKGLPNFFRLLKRDRTKNPNENLKNLLPVNYIIFDILELNGESLLSTPLEKRLNILKDVINETNRLKIIQSTLDGKKLFDFVLKKGLEGIVSKRKKGLYYPGKKHPTWHKIKNFKYISACVGGLIYRNKKPTSLVLGIKQKQTKDKLINIGRASTGLSEKDFDLLNQFSKQLASSSPFSEKIYLKNNEEVIFLVPKLFVKVKFMEWTPNNTLRSPVIEGFINQK